MSALYTEFETAARLNISVTTLRAWRSTRRVALPFVKLGRAVRYRPEDLEKFITVSTAGGEQ